MFRKGGDGDNEVIDFANLGFLNCGILVFLEFFGNAYDNYDFREGFGKVWKSILGIS